eukprot:COSAG01_NODE_51951_length_350_cov_1.402390_1_plen_54_part_10
MGSSQGARALQRPWRRRSPRLYHWLTVFWFLERDLSDLKGKLARRDEGAEVGTG